MEAAARMPALLRTLSKGGSRVAQLQAAQRLTELLISHPLALDPSPSSSNMGQTAPAAKAMFVAEGGVQTAVQLLRSGTQVMQQAAAYLLAAACTGFELCSSALAAAGGIPLLLSMLWSAGSLEASDLRIAAAARALACATAASAAAAEEAAAAGGVAGLTALLHTAVERQVDWLQDALTALLAILQLDGGQASDAITCGTAGTVLELLAQWPARDVGCVLEGAVGRARGLEAPLPGGAAEPPATLGPAGGEPATVGGLSNRDLLAQLTAALVFSRLMEATPVGAAIMGLAGSDSLLQQPPDSSDAKAWQCAADSQAALAAAEQPEAAAGQTAAADGGISTAKGPHGLPAQPARLPRLCASLGCGTTRGLRRCGGCGAVRYCSPECSRAHWQAHKTECRRLQVERAAEEAREPASGL